MTSAALLAISQLLPWCGILVLVGYVPLIWATRHESPKKTFKLVFVATIVQYLATLYWLTITMSVFGHLPWAVSCAALTLLCMMIGCYVAGAIAFARYLSMRLGWSYLALFPVALCAIEYVRNYGFIGQFPWGASAYSLLDVPVLLQGASLVGVYGMVYFVGLVNAGVSRVRVGGVLILLLAWTAYGAWRIHTFDTSALKKIKVALLQGNIEQGIKNHAPQYGDQILTRYNLLQTAALSSGAEIVIWPETSYPYRLSVETPRFVGLENLAPINIIPTVGVDTNDQFYNAAFVLNNAGDILGHFYKTHLVPFGEYQPWPFELVVDKLVPNLGTFARGKDFRPLDVNGTSIAVTVCYEGVFPEIGRAFVDRGAQLFINVTNDAWFGDSAGPYQHLGMYQMRSVEVGRSYARATNTGVSAWVDARGNLHQATPLYEEALVLADIPISTETTIYQQIGDLVPQVCLAILLIGLVIARRPRSKSDWLWAFSGLAIILAAHAYLAPAKQALDESANTKEWLFVMLGLWVWLQGSRRQP